jgi:hypothetical protein
MGIHANFFLDAVAIWQRMVFPLFSILFVIISEYKVYRIICPKQGIFRAILTSVYANIISGILGIFIIDTVVAIAASTAFSISLALGIKDRGYMEGIVLFIFLFILTWLVEAVAIGLLRNKLRITRVIFATGIANLASYTIIVTMMVAVGSVDIKA